jgi:hypothetical protein
LVGCHDKLVDCCLELDNVCHHPARASEVTIGKTADRVLGVHGIVIWHPKRYQCSALFRDHHLTTY